MFYPVDSLRRGGRFYLCWVADSWPLRFATITHRQLCSKDIRVICDDLLEVIINESGRPTHRFSLRLSSQLLRGLVRLYQRKVNVFLGELCRINANVFKHANKKWTIQEVDVVHRVRRPLAPLEIQEMVQEQPETERGVMEMIQASGNAVANIQDITLREPTELVPEIQLRPDDGFGEEQDTLALLQDRTLEHMLAADRSAALSGLPLDVTDRSHDRTDRHIQHALMESIPDHELTMFRKSNAEELVPDFDKDIPEIPEIPPPEIPVPPPAKSPEVPVPEEPIIVAVEPANVPEQEEIELEELEPQTKRRRIRNKLIVDKKIKISTEHFRARIDNPLVDLRCTDSSDDIIFIKVSPEAYFRRPCHGGSKISTNVGFEISRLFSRNLGVVSGQPLAEREIEEVMHRTDQPISRPLLERIEEEPEAIIPHIQIHPEQSTTTNVTGELLMDIGQLNVTHQLNVTGQVLDVSEVPRVSVEPMELDTAEVLTQKVETLSQERKRLAGQETVISPKRQRSVGYVSFRESQLAKLVSSQVADPDADKENRPDNFLPQPEEPIHQNVEPNRQSLAPTRQSAKQTRQSLEPNRQSLEPTRQSAEPSRQSLEPTIQQNAEMIVSSMLQEAGLADIQPPPIVIETVRTSQRVSRGKSGKGTHSDSSETPLGSLDRTRVSLGDSEQTTDSKRFIRDHWGTEGTMLKILKFVKVGRKPVTINSLVSKGPIIAGHERIICARCFTSILKLKQHGFIKVCKDPSTLEIKDITLGPKLASSQEHL